MWAKAPSSMRTSASTATCRDDVVRALIGETLSRGIDAAVAAETGPPRRAGHRPLALGLHLVEHEIAVGGTQRRAGDDRAGPGSSAVGCGRVRTPDLHPPAVDPEPRT